MTTYGTIQTSPTTKLEYIPRAKQRIKTGLGTRRSWKTMFDLRSFGVPAAGVPDAVSRVRVNVAYFRMNYAMVALIVFLLLMAAWLFLYFLRDEPLVLLGHLVDDRLVLLLMAVLTVVLLVFTDAALNILVAVLVAVVVVVAHTAFRKTEDLFLDEEEAVHVGAAAS